MYRPKLMNVAWLVGIFALIVALPGPAVAQSEATAPTADRVDPLEAPSDPEDCLACHRFRGLSRLDPETGELRLMFTSDRHYAEQEGPHSRLRCTGCHERSEVETIPHKETTPVDCTTSCHLVSGGGAAITFSHKKVAEKLERSAHDLEALGKLNFPTPPLREGQSTCLYCHDQPVFRDVVGAKQTHRGFDATARCESCHDDELPVDVDYYLHHTASRLQAERPVREATQVCAACHSNPGLDLESHDAVASYFHSFHGKAAQLGATDTAVCVDCHASETGDVHLMMAASDPASTTHPDNLKTTCRSAQCHPSAVPELSEAAVHMHVTPDDPTPEWYLTAGFVALAASVLLFYMLVVMMELLNFAVRRHSREHHYLIKLAKAVEAHPEARSKLERLSVHQRFQHWALAISFSLLVATGLPMRSAYIEWWPDFLVFFHGLEGARIVHRVSGVILLAMLGYHVLYLLSQLRLVVKRRLRDEPGTSGLKIHIDELINFAMIPTPTDIKQFIQLLLHLLGLRKERPHQGKFHFSQKFEYWGVFWGSTILGVSGVFLWNAATLAEVFGGRALNFAIIVHSIEAFLAFIHVAVIHFYGVIFSPAVFPLSKGSLSGMMPAAETAEGHIGFLEDIAAEYGIEVEEDQHHDSIFKQLVLRSYAVVLIGVVIWVGKVSIPFFMAPVFGDEPAPDDVLDVTLAIHGDDLRADVDASDMAGARSVVREDRFKRGPMAHFHVIPPWYTPDPGNGCATSGCHAALPHGERKEVRAFLNMHTTFVDCQVCHREEEPAASEVTWVSLSDRSQRPAPALLRLAHELETPLSGDLTERQAQDARLKELLSAAVTESGGDDELQRWLINLETARFDGKLYAAFVGEIRRGIGLHSHGEYGAKLGLTSGAFQLEGDAITAGRKLAAGDKARALPEAERESLSKTVHRGFAKPEVNCTRCHSDEQELMVDFEALGFSPNRAAALRSNTIVRQSKAVEDGETFYLPNLFGAPAAPVETPRDGAEVDLQ